MSTKTKVLSLYKTMLRESQKFPSYNYREYAVRRIRDAFRENRNLSDSTTMENHVKYAKESLQIIRRQTVIGDLYKTDKLVIEK
ncbi:Protein bcn92 [Sergentomyia squamirostris]